MYVNKSCVKSCPEFFDNESLAPPRDDVSAEIVGHNVTPI